MPTVHVVPDGVTTGDVGVDAVRTDGPAESGDCGNVVDVIGFGAYTDP